MPSKIFVSHMTHYDPYRIFLAHKNSLDFLFRKNLPRAIESALITMLQLNIRINNSN